MEKEFVPYELALRLKALGFDEPCLAYYNKKELFSFTQICNEPLESHYIKMSNRLCTPLYQQAFRWFREKYGYWSYIKEATKGTCRFYIEKFDEKFFNSDIIDSYEEAELACLEKLIKIVEQKEK